MLADLDDFKAINDRHGHPCGDMVLREFALDLRAAACEEDIAGRWGGEEFALVCAVRLHLAARSSQSGRAPVSRRGSCTSETAPC